MYEFDGEGGGWRGVLNGNAESEFDKFQTLPMNLEELDEIRAYDAAKSGDDEEIPFEVAVAEIERG